MWVILVPERCHMLITHKNAKHCKVYLLSGKLHCDAKAFPKVDTQSLKYVPVQLLQENAASVPSPMLRRQVQDGEADDYAQRSNIAVVTLQRSFL